MREHPCPIPGPSSVAARRLQPPPRSRDRRRRKEQAPPALQDTSSQLPPSPLVLPAAVNRATLLRRCCSPLYERREDPSSRITPDGDVVSPKRITGTARLMTAGIRSERRARHER